MSSLMAVQGTLTLVTVKARQHYENTMFSAVPPNYDAVYRQLSQRGARVLALGRKELGRLSHFEENDPRKATLARVTPTPNNGFAELVPLQRVKEIVEIEDEEGGKEEEEEEENSHKKKRRRKEEEETIYFIFQKVKYIYRGSSNSSSSSSSSSFHPLQYPINCNFNFYLQSRGYQDQDQVDKQTRKYGPNLLQMDIPEFMELFKERATAPFFVFQVFCVGLWCLDEYWYYSLFTLFMLVVFECTLVQQQLRNMAEIRKMGAQPYSIQVYRSRRWRPMPTTALLPGDIVSVIRTSSTSSSTSSTSSVELMVPCDLLLLRGSCVVDESMLTGESIPQMKEGLEGLEERERETMERNLDIATDSKLHMLYAGTKIVQHSSPPKTTTGLRAPDNGCVCYVLRTGFATAQGRLLKTILYGVSRVTANNMETLAFILFLLVFAVAAAAYVWVKGVEDPDRSRYKLFLECTLILTSVVPPELPIELSLAVNTSLLALSKLYVFCTEPFRIPLAGKIDVCAFDKTGTLTSDDLIVEGVAGLKGTAEVIPVSEAPAASIQVLASCHSLVQLEEGLVGDPQEKATLSAIDWTLTKGDAVIPKRGRATGLRITHRYHFTSVLKRMCVVAAYTQQTGEVVYVACVKGAPETLRDMFSAVPPNYDAVYRQLSQRGARVLALGRKELGRLSHSEVRSITRNDLESDLTFCGFIIISCPLKRDSKEVIREILASSHAAVIITGDSYLTACHVAKELRFTQKESVLVLQRKDTERRRRKKEEEEEEEEEWEWQDIEDPSLSLPLSLSLSLGASERERERERDGALKQYDLCLTGEGLAFLHQCRVKALSRILPAVKIFARVSPKQKELIITLYKDLGFTALMCGDGTNDVGALKHAHCGVAILSTAPDRPVQPRRRQTERQTERQPDKIRQRKAVRSGGQNLAPQQVSESEQLQRAQLQLNKLLQDFEDETNTLVKLGDASIAAPFTSKLSSIQCVCHIIKQGRCTLVTTLQMFKILALNALILAYSQSVLYLDGIKFSDYQATLQGLLQAACFLFISRSKPLPELSAHRPLPNIFNIYTVATVLLQFGCHFTALLYLVNQANHLDNHTAIGGAAVDLEKQFEPSLLNSTVYIISLALQVSTFAINYRGRPYMEGLSENRPLLYSLMGAFGLILALSLGIFPDFGRQFEIVEFPSEFRVTLIQVLCLDFALSFVIDRVCLALFGEGKLAPSLRH
ncbi:endoplasmic reticulum transmembrane helix translocase-like isoform X6 [Eriocheir sinensis]|nr:endoplasmic reticulum transmembrane helix translocase-like isoform X6 [Eriocheir sinensis]